MKKFLALLLALTMVLSLGAVAFADDEITLDVIISEYGSYTREWWDGWSRGRPGSITPI